MHDDYLNPALRQLRDQQVRFAPRDKKLEQAAAAEKLLAEMESSRTYTYEYLCFRITRYRPESYPDLKTTGKEAAQRSAAFHRRSVGRGQPPRPQRRRGGTDGRRFEQEVPGLDEDGVALAAAGAGQSPVRLRRPEAGGVPRQFGATFRGSQSGAGAARGPVQSTEHGGTVGNHRPRAEAGPGGRLPGGGHQTPLSAQRTQRGNRPLHLEAVRPRTSRDGHFSRQHGPVAGGDKAQDLSTVPPRPIGGFPGQTVLPDQDEHLPHRRRDAGDADHGTADGLYSQRRLRGSAPRSGNASSRVSRLRFPSIPCRRRPACPADCLPTWRACTRCRC